MNRTGRISRLVFGLGTTVFAGACGGIPALPDSLDVATSAADKAPAAKGTGSEALADSTWELVRKADPEDPVEGDGEGAAPGPYGGLLGGNALDRPPVGDRIFLVDFGPGGQMVEVRENRFFLAGIYGSTVPVGGSWQGTSLPGITFQSDTYGLQAGERFGVATVVNVRLGNIFLGQATLYSWGTVAGDVIDGQFGYLLDFTEGLVSTLGRIADQYPIDGRRLDP